MMEPAKKRRRLSDGAEHATGSESADKPTKDTTHSLFVRSLPASITQEKLIEHFSQSYPLKHATVVLDPKTKISKGFGFVTFTDAEDARQAQLEFNDSVLDGRKIKVELAEARNREVDNGLEGKTHARNTKGEELRAKRQAQQEENQPPKLIVRNLPWSIKTPEDLTKLFLSFGKVKYAVVPKLPGEKGQAGFGIVIIRGKKNAERAMQGVNGKVVDGRTLAVDWAVDRETWEKLQKSEAKSDTKEVPMEDANGLDVADQEGAKNETSADDGEGVMLDDLEESEAVSDSVDENEFIDSIGDEEADDLSASDISDLADQDLASSEVPKTYNTEETTVFIRNLPYDIDDETLYEHFTTNFAPIRYARVVYDPETSRPRGTAFICFRNADDAKSCVQSCPKPETSFSDRQYRGKASVGPPSILQNENADPTGKYTLGNRLLHVTRALPKEDAETRAADGARSRMQKQKADKRHLYLLSEGTVSPGSTLYNSLSKPDLDIRQSSLRQRQKLVKSNPNLGLSLTRLSIRNLPRFIDQTALKQLARQAIVGFASDVKEGRRQAISKEELARDGETGKKAEADRREKGKGVVKQAKIVYEAEKTGTKLQEGKGGRSRGYGFLEFYSHRNALMGLRWLNGHKVNRAKEEKGKGGDDGERGKRLIVEFAIENAQVVQRRSERERRVKVRKDQAVDRDGVEDQPRDKGKDLKRKRDGQDEKSSQSDKKQKKTDGKKKAEVVVDDKAQDEKNKVAARNRIIAQKRQKRRNRKGGS